VEFRGPNFLLFSLFFKKFTFDPLDDIKSSSDLGIDAITHSFKVTHLGATDLGSEVSGRAQQDIRGGAYVAGTSEPQIL
jgi:hypothetical protein